MAYFAKNTGRYLLLFIAGGLGYGLLEIIYRGYTHWSMLITGGVCLLLLYMIAVTSRESVWKRWLMGGMVITTVEFVAGIIVNIRMDWQVWDYSGLPLNLMGQICAIFFLMWTALSVPIMWVCRRVDPYLFPERKNRGGTQLLDRETGDHGADGFGAAGGPHCE